MAAQLDYRIKTVISQRNELETVLSSMLEGVIALNNEERIISMNTASAGFFDCDPDVFMSAIQICRVKAAEKKIDINPDFDSRTNLYGRFDWLDRLKGQ